MSKVNWLFFGIVVVGLVISTPIINHAGSVTFSYTPVNRLEYDYYAASIEPHIDLVVLSMRFSNFWPATGETITIYTSLRNNGNLPSDPFTVSFFDHLNGSDPKGYARPIGKVTVNGLKPDEYKEVSIQFGTTKLIGNHTIYAEINKNKKINELTFENNLWAEDIEVLSIRIPDVQIIHPLNGTLLSANKEVLLFGQVTTYQRGFLSDSSLKWYDNGNLLGTGNRLSVNLTKGRHTIKLIVNDSKNNKGSDSVFIEVFEPKYPSLVPI